MDDLIAFLRGRHGNDRERAHFLRVLGALQPPEMRDELEGIAASIERKVEADGRILDEHDIVHRQIGWLEDGEEGNAEIPVCRRCVPKHSWYGCRADVPQGPCLTARLLAVPYFDHPDYREEWKP
jgi:hypothetical protein